MANTSPFYDLENFRNSLYVLNIAIEDHFAPLILNNDYERIIYSTTEYAFRRRSQNQTLNNLNFPFMNYKCKSILPQVKRPWWNHVSNIDGIYIPELQKKLRYTPITIQYDATFFCHRDDELQYAYYQMLWDGSNENKLTPIILVDGQEIALIAVLYYNLTYDPEYKERDWLERNKIHSISIDFELELMYIKDNTSKFCIPEKVIYTFSVLHGNNNDISYQEQHKFLRNHFENENEEIL